MANLAQGVRKLPVDGKLEDIVEALNREIVPVLSAIREEVQRLSGSQLTTDEDVTLDPDVAVVICTNTGAITVTLPDASEYAEKRVVVVRTNAAVTVESVGGDIQGASSQSPTTLLAVVSDGTDWWLTASA